MLLIGLLIFSVLSACSSAVASMSSPTEAPSSVSTDSSTFFTPTPEFAPTAAPSQEQLSGIPYSSVGNALADLKTRKGVSVEILQGWTIVRESDGLTNWSFVPPDHPAYPAVAKRVLYRDQDGWHLKMDVLCEAEKAACDEFIRYFEAVNAPMYQYIESHQ
jgi:hypothetical protein